MFQRGHRRDIAGAMVLRGNSFLRGNGPGGQPRRQHPGNQQAPGQHGARGGRDDRDDGGGGHRQHHGDTDRQHRTHQHVGQLVDIGSDAGHQFAAVPAHHRVDGPASQPCVDPFACRAGGPQRRVV
jgi:hypothetical protein